MIGFGRDSSRGASTTPCNICGEDAFEVRRTRTRFLRQGIFWEDRVIGQAKFLSIIYQTGWNPLKRQFLNEAEKDQAYSELQSWINLHYPGIEIRVKDEVRSHWWNVLRAPVLSSILLQLVVTGTLGWLTLMRFAHLARAIWILCLDIRRYDPKFATARITPLHVTYASGRKLMYLAFQQFIILVFSFGMIGGLIVFNGSLFQDMCGASESLSPFAWFGIYLVVIHMGTGLVRKLFKLAKCKWRRRGGLA